MAELVDAPDSKSGYRKVVQVRFLFRAQLVKELLQVITIYYVIISSYLFSLLTAFILKPGFILNAILFVAHVPAHVIMF